MTLNRFIILTRGRTGSTPIIDELNGMRSVLAEQELFIKQDFSGQIDKYNKDIQPIPPFYLWKILPSKRHKARLPFFKDRRRIQIYLNEIEKRVVGDDFISAFGFKTLSYHFDETPGLLENLINRQYRVIYLKRTTANQVISAMIAELRGGIYNTQDSFHDNKRYEINLRQMKFRIKNLENGVANDLALLSRNKFKHILVSYEDYLNRRDAFFKNITNFLNIQLEIPKPTKYSIMIKDMKQTIKNYQAVEDCLKDIGMELQ